MRSKGEFVWPNSTNIFRSIDSQTDQAYSVLQSFTENWKSNDRSILYKEYAGLKLRSNDPSTNADFVCNMN
jgi:hypothetical protein